MDPADPPVPPGPAEPPSVVGASGPAAATGVPPAAGDLADDLARRVHRASHLTGTFVLRSGATSSEYFDKYRFESDPRLLWEIAEALAGLLPPAADGLAGLELGGVPLATVLSQVTGLPAGFVRKQAKPYGTRRLAEGLEVAGRRLVVVEDVVTSGGAVVDSCLAGRFGPLDLGNRGDDQLVQAPVEAEQVLVGPLDPADQVLVVHRDHEGLADEHVAALT